MEHRSDICLTITKSKAIKIVNVNVNYHEAEYFLIKKSKIKNI